jgi:protein-S-isoprenylcysteine O-methyltransferase Ste14
MGYGDTERSRSHAADDQSRNSTASKQSGLGIITGKLRLNRGPLRWWLIVMGVLWVQFNPLRFATGVVLVIVGAAIHVISKGYLRRTKESRLVLTTTGPYRFTRNPFYLGNLVAEVGLLIIIGQIWVTVAYLTVWAWVYYRQISAEQTRLSRLLPAEYAQYRKHVPPLIPLPWRFLPADSVHGSRFSWSNPSISHGAELERALRLVSYPFLLLCSAAVHLQGPSVLLRPSSGVVAAGLGFLAVNCVGRITTRLMHLRKARSKRGRSQSTGSLDRAPIVHTSIAKRAWQA